MLESMGQAIVPLLWVWMSSYEFCRLHYTLLWTELQYSLDEYIPVISDISDTTVAVVAIVADKKSM